MTDTEVLQWLDRQQDAYRLTAFQLADVAKLPVVESERRRAGWTCEDCGRLPYPNALHKRWCPWNGVPVEAGPVDENDDDLPF